MEFDKALPTLAVYEELSINNKELETIGKDYRGCQLVREKTKNAFFLASVDRMQTTVSMPPSTKTTAAMAVILHWIVESPSDKILGTDCHPMFL